MNGDSDDRQRFLESNWTLAYDVIKAADEHSDGDRVVVLADMKDQNGATFVRFIGDDGIDARVSDSAWAAHFSRKALALLLYCSWPSLKKVIGALRSEEYGNRRWCLVIAHGGAQLRGALQEAGK